MSVNKVVSLLSLLVALAAICVSENIRSEVVLVDSVDVETGEAQVDVSADFSGETFHATNEWQEVKPGQVLPSGLHYRYEYSIITSTITCIHTSTYLSLPPHRYLFQDQLGDGKERGEDSGPRAKEETGGFNRSDR